MNRCRSKRGKQPRLILRSKGKYGLCRTKFAVFVKSCPKIHHRGHRDHEENAVLIRNPGNQENRTRTFSILACPIYLLLDSHFGGNCPHPPLLQREDCLPRGSGGAQRELPRYNGGNPKARTSRVPAFLIEVLLESWFPDSFWRTRFS